MKEVFENINLDNVSNEQLENIGGRLDFFLDTLDPDIDTPAWEFFCELEQVVMKAEKP